MTLSRRMKRKNLVSAGSTGLVFDPYESGRDWGYGCYEDEDEWEDDDVDTGDYPGETRSPAQRDEDRRTCGIMSCDHRVLQTREDCRQWFLRFSSAYPNEDPIRCGFYYNGIRFDSHDTSDLVEKLWTYVQTM